MAWCSIASSIPSDKELKVSKERSTYRNPGASIGTPMKWPIHIILYKGCSKSKASCFILLAHCIRGRCWWSGSRGWTFPPIPLYILLMYNRWQQRGSLTKWCLTWKCVWSKGMALNSSMQEKNETHWHSSMLAECLWRPNGYGYNLMFQFSWQLCIAWILKQLTRP